MPDDDSTQRRLQDNPAGRLLVILQRAITVQPGGHAKDAWRNVLDVAAEDDVGLFRRLSEAMALPGRIKVAVEALRGEDHRLLLQWLPPVEDAFQVPLESGWEGVLNRIDAAVLYGAEVCADRLSRDAPEPIPSQTALADLQDQVNALLLEASDAEIPDTLRVFVTRLLSQMDAAIRDVRFRGAASLRDIAEQTIGALGVRDYTSEGAAERNNEASRRIKTKLLAVAATFLMALNIVNQSAELVQRFAGELPPGQEAPARPHHNP